MANALAAYLSPGAEVRVWADVFDLGDTNIETLFRELDSADYAVLVTTCDDKVRSRGREKPAARDNVLFEAGLFMGRIGRKRTFLVCDSDLRLPTDLAGVTIASFSSKESLRADSLQRAAKKILQAIGKTGSNQDIDFLRAYLGFIDPSKVELWQTYAEILRAHYDRIASELERLRQNHDWRRLLKVKERLREYFEYTGMYREGVEFGRSYVTALRGLRRHYDAAWSQVKDVGYMLILSGNYKDGRSAIHEILDSRPVWGAAATPDQQAQLLCYANRYLAVSYYRDRARRNLLSARECLEKARAQLALLPANSKEYCALSARLLRNQGHLELEHGQVELAIKYYRESLSEFLETGDEEHIGTSQLSLAKALIEQDATSVDEAYGLLKNAGTAFSRIGWLEGQARVQEQLARYWLASAARAAKAGKAALLREAGAALDSSEVMFERVHSGRFHGRLDELRGRWRKAIESL